MTLAEISQQEAALAALQQQEAGAAAEMELRRKQFALLLAAVDDLQASRPLERAREDCSPSLPARRAGSVVIRAVPAERPPLSPPPPLAY